MHERLDLAGRMYALLTGVDRAHTAAIFVHGFSGCPEKTWVQFQSLIDGVAATMPWWEQCDAYFYSYNSRHQIGPNTAALLDFICNVYPSPDWSRLGTEPSVARRNYNNLILVGHSEGGVLIRMAILRRAQSRGPEGSVLAPAALQDKILQANVRLFAPAFWGSLLSGYKGLLMRTPVLGDLVESLLNTSAAYQQLKPTSPLLEDLRTRTTTLAKEYPQLRAFRAKNLFGGRDTIVTAEALATDPPAEYEREHDHGSICKPTRRYLRPLAFVRDEQYVVSAA